MRAAVLRGGSVEARTVADPVPGPGQLLVRSLACGICASDLHFMDHPEAGADDDSGMSTYDQDVGIVMGHEYCAEVVDYGPGTERRIPVGTRVSSLPVLATPAGRRIIGQSPEAPGGFGELFLLTEAITRVVVSDLPSEIVCVADAISVGWSTASRAQLTMSEAPLVIGCGAIALSAIGRLRNLGVGPIVAADLVASRRATALAMGADVVVDASDSSASATRKSPWPRRAATRPVTGRVVSCSSASASRAFSTRSSRGASAVPGSSPSAARRRATICTP